MSITCIWSSGGKGFAFSYCLRYNREGWEEKEARKRRCRLPVAVDRGFASPSRVTLGSVDHD
jgi:hypothetical protein